MRRREEPPLQPASSAHRRQFGVGSQIELDLRGYESTMEQGLLLEPATLVVVRGHGGSTRGTRETEGR